MLATQTLNETRHVETFGARERLVTVLCNCCIGETAALEGTSGLIGVAPNRWAKVFLSTPLFAQNVILESHGVLRFPDARPARRPGDARHRAEPLVGLQPVVRPLEVEY